MDGRRIQYQTLKWSLAGMTALMHLQLAATEKTFATEVAQMRLHSRMDQHVCIQCVPRNEFRFALAARVAAHSSTF